MVLENLKKMEFLNKITILQYNKSAKSPWLIQNEVQNENPKKWRLLLLTSKNKTLSSFGFRPYTVNEKKTNHDEELVVGPLKYYLQHTILMKHREVAAMSKLQNFALWKEVNKTITHGKRVQMICQKWTT